MHITELKIRSEKSKIPRYCCRVGGCCGISLAHVLVPCEPVVGQSLWANCTGMCLPVPGLSPSLMSFPAASGCLTLFLDSVPLTKLQNMWWESIYQTVTSFYHGPLQVAGFHSVSCIYRPNKGFLEAERPLFQPSSNQGGFCKVRVRTCKNSCFAILGITLGFIKIFWYWR